jgi:hypothetical protein
MAMLLRNRPPRLDSRPAITSEGFEHLPAEAVSVLRWLSANRVEFVLVGAVARAIRGETGATGPVAIVPAPYGRNLDRLARALISVHARERYDAEMWGTGGSDGPPIKFDAEKLVRPDRWALRCGDHDLDVEGRSPETPHFQELLYESSRFEVASEVTVEVAAPEDIEHYDHVRRTGSAPQMKVSRAVRDPDQTA